MADFGAPAVTPAQFDPNAGIRSLSNIMNLQRTQQALQSGSLGIQQQQQNLNVGAANLQQEQQKMTERQLLQTAMQSGKDPDGNPIKGPDGQVDPGAMANFANKYMPLTGQGVQQSIIQTLHNRLQLNDAVRGLGQNYRNDLSGIVRSAIGTQQTPQQISAALDAYGKQNPEAAPAISRAQALINAAPASMPQAQRDQALQHLAMEFQPAGTTASEQAPQMGVTTGPGGGAQAYNTNPYSATPMGAVGPETAQGVPLDQRQTVGTNPITGGQTVISKSGAGQITSITNPPTQGVYVPQPGDAQALPVLQAERDASRVAYTNAGLQHTNNQIVLNNIDNVAATGVAGPAFRNIASAFGLRAGDATDSATAYDMVGKGLERSALQAAQSMGPQTNAGLAAQVAANGSTHYTPAAIKEITKLNDAIVSGTQAYQPGLERAIAANPSAGVFAKREFDQAWGANFDPRIFQLYNAQKSGDAATVKSIISELGGKDSAQFKALMNKAAKLNQLSNAGSLR